jgi:hypothetical protein
LSVAMFAVSACSSGGTSPTPPVTRSATQTPWVIYVPITFTPEPATVTPLPPATASVKATAARTPTRVAVAVPTKAPVAPPTKAAPPQPAVVVPSLTAAPACSAPAVTLFSPGPADERKTKEKGPGSDTFVLKWAPFTPGDSDALMGYRIDLTSRLNGRTVNGDVVYVSHNAFLNNGQQYIYDSLRVYNLAAPAGESVNVEWTVTVVKTTGSFDNQGGVSGTVVKCSPPSAPLTIPLKVVDS